MLRKGIDQNAQMLVLLQCLNNDMIRKCLPSLSNILITRIDDSGYILFYKLGPCTFIQSDLSVLFLAVTAVR